VGHTTPNATPFPTSLTASVLAIFLAFSSAFLQFSRYYNHQKMPALKLDLEEPMTVEERVARVEANVEHIQADVSDIKIDVRRLSDKIDAVDVKLTAKIDAVDTKLTGKIDAVNQKLDDFRVSVEKGFAELRQRIGDLKTDRAFDRVWFLLISAGVLGIMAKAFKWF
jgi:tetrahydromethanopterin S-methyltransferase subunit G